MGNNQSNTDERSKLHKANKNQTMAESIFTNSGNIVVVGGIAPVLNVPGVVLEAGNFLDDEGDKEDASALVSTSKPETLKVFKSSDLKNENLVGVGGFGKVLEGVLQGQHVAVKVFHSPLNMEQAQAQIGLLMALNHRNLVKIKGIISNSVDFRAIECPQVILDYFPEGSLLKFLNNKENPQDYAMLGKLALDIVHACEYLHSNGIIHGNLAARNVMVQRAGSKKKTHFNAKVADYGISAVAKGCGENHMILPSGKTVSVRWAPKELVMENGKDSTFASDVWSFGVVLWEMWTKGATPFGAACSNMDVIISLMEDKSPLSILKPKNCPKHILAVMESIFKVEPSDRPTFSKLKDEFESFKQKAKAIKKEKEGAPGKVAVQTEACCEAEKNKNDPICNPQAPKAKAKAKKEKGGAPGNVAVQGEAVSDAGNKKISNPQAPKPKANPDPGQQNQKGPQKKGPAPPNQNTSKGNKQRGAHNQPGRKNPPACPTSPPPYTPNPLPNHLAVGADTPMPGPQMMFRIVPQQFSTGGSGTAPKPNYDDEINRRREEIKMLTAQKTVEEIQRKTAELTEMIASAANLNIGVNPQAGYQFSNPGATGTFPKQPHGGHKSRGGGRGRGRGQVKKEAKQ